MELNPKLFEKVFDLAHRAGLAAVEKTKPEPMIVAQHSDPLNDASPVVRQYNVPSGPCGFAWIRIRPGTSSFARWLKKEHGATPSYYGGIDYHIHGLFEDFRDQSIDYKSAYAHAFANVLREFGIKANAGSRLD